MSIFRRETISCVLRNFSFDGNCGQRAPGGSVDGRSVLIILVRCLWWDRCAGGSCVDRVAVDWHYHRRCTNNALCGDRRLFCAVAINKWRVWSISSFRINSFENYKFFKGLNFNLQVIGEEKYAFQNWPSWKRKIPMAFATWRSKFRRAVFRCVSIKMRSNIHLNTI